MATFTQHDDFRAAQFIGADLHGARFVASDLSGVVMRGVDVQGADIDAPWLLDSESALHVNGVDVAPFVEDELNRRFPGRAQRRASDPGGLRAAWSVLEGTWSATMERVATMSAEMVDVSIDGEWSFSQTLRHLVLATDMWLGKAVLAIDQPFHPLGLVNVEDQSADDTAVSPTFTPPWAEVLQARSGRTGMVRDFLATVTSDELAVEHSNPHDPSYPETTLSCLHTILEEEWEHHRYAVRDLNAIESGSGA